jgi:hypothetical protein
MTINTRSIDLGLIKPVVGTTDPKGPSLPRFLVEEIPATDGLPVWRRDDQKGALALRLTAGGLAGIGAGQDTEEDTAQTPQQKRGTKRPTR